jgi:hypothetical protein
VDDRAAETKEVEAEIELAEFIFNALRKLDKHAHVQGDPKNDDEISIDGNFNLRILAAMLLKDRL